MVKKITLITLYLLFHLFVMRDVRTWMFSSQFDADLIERVENSTNLRFEILDIRLVYFEYEKDDFHKFWHYKVPFGSFFLIGMVGLIVLNARRHYYFILIGIHVLVLLICSIIFMMDIAQYYQLLIITDLLSRYLIPLCSIGIIPLAFLERKEGSGEI